MIFNVIKDQQGKKKTYSGEKSNQGNCFLLADNLVTTYFSMCHTDKKQKLRSTVKQEAREVSGGAVTGWYPSNHRRYHSVLLGIDFSEVF